VKQERIAWISSSLRISGRFSAISESRIGADHFANCFVDVLKAGQVSHLLADRFQPLLPLGEASVCHKPFSVQFMLAIILQQAQGSRKTCFRAGRTVFQSDFDTLARGVSAGEGWFIDNVRVSLRAKEA
jgi:hypothetical protein